MNVTQWLPASARAAAGELLGAVANRPRFSLLPFIHKNENPFMTRKDYVAIATALHHAYRTCENPHIRTWEAAVLRLAEAFKADNPRFDSERFINACYGIP